MLLTIGRRRQAVDLPDLLLDCHERIRHFSTLAVRLAREDASDDERRGVAAGVARYFEQALPLHVRDEDESILPRLRGRGKGDLRVRLRVWTPTRLSAREKQLFDELSKLEAGKAPKPGKGFMDKVRDAFGG